MPLSAERKDDGRRKKEVKEKNYQLHDNDSTNFMTMIQFTSFVRDCAMCKLIRKSAQKRKISQLS